MTQKHMLEKESSFNKLSQNNGIIFIANRNQIPYHLIKKKRKERKRKIFHWIKGLNIKPEAARKKYRGKISEQMCKPEIIAKIDKGESHGNVYTTEKTIIKVKI